MGHKVWKVANPLSDQALQLATVLGVSPLLGQLLLNRGITEPETAAAFLKPELSQLHDPFLLPGMERAISRIQQAIRVQEPVLVYGDYDVDGITSVALLIRVMARLIPGKLLYYIPKRLEEGYGLHTESLEKALDRGVSLIITVDCGISALEEATYLKSRGVDLIITDHHEPPAILPEAYAIINPKLPGGAYPFTQLAGVGVAFKLLQGLVRPFPELEPRLLDNLDLVAFGTVADIVPLVGENRVLVKYGLERLEKTGNAGIQALIEVAAVKNRPVGCSQIGYVLAPRINAAGRMGNPSVAVKLFLTSDPAKTQEYARELENQNQLRQEIENRVLTEAQEQLRNSPGLLDGRALVLAGDNWHLGVIGIVASKLVEIYNKPVILIGLDGDEGRGSGRSIAGFNLFQAVEKCGHFLNQFGGHEFAVGLGIRRDRVSEFREAFMEFAKERLTAEDLTPVLKVESMMPLDGLTLDLVKELNLLAPCGPSNPVPVLGCRSLHLISFKNVGENGKHLKLTVTDDRVVKEAIGFNLGFVNQELAATPEVDVAFSLEENSWNGVVQVQLNLKDVVCNREAIGSE
ncbi:MAG TPA: single-stranded-DNA-specific exonuclease RecJ [Bacillota bacterium]